MLIRLLSVLGFALLLPALLVAHEGHHPVAAEPAAERASGDQSAVAREMARAVRAFMDSLNPEQKAAAGFEFKYEERFNWHFVPRARKGLSLRDMTEGQRELARAMLRTALSDKGTQKVLTIMSLEQVLHDIEQTKGPRRDAENYSWTVFGSPDAKMPWGWRVEGHHVSLNFTIIGDRAVAAGPAFLGANPAEVKSGDKKGLRALAEEEDLARALIKSLPDEQRKKAILNIATPKEIITGNQRKAMLKEYAGIAASDLTDAQRAALMDLVGTYAHRLRKELAEEDLRRIAHAGIAQVHFAWAGALEPGQGHYYRIHGPTFLVEYDNTQNNANHIHSVWRDLENDFGGDVLRRHYDQAGDHR